MAVKRQGTLPVTANDLCLQGEVDPWIRIYEILVQNREYLPHDNTHFAASNIKNMFIKYMITTCYFGMRDAMYNHTDRTSLAIGWHRSM